MANFELRRSEITNDNLEALAMQLVCCCLIDRNQWRIIIDSDGSGLKRYYMVDFSDCGEPFTDGIACVITLGGEDFDKDPSAVEYQAFSSIFAALPVIASLMSLNDRSYVESF